MISLTIEAQVYLPEGVDDKNINQETGQLNGEQRERAIQALFACLPQRADVFIDGKDQRPAAILIEYSDYDAEVRVE